MRHLAAYLLLQIGGNASPTAEDVKGVLASVGIEADDERLEKLIAELDGKDVNAVSSMYASSEHAFTLAVAHRRGFSQTVFCKCKDDHACTGPQLVRRFPLVVVVVQRRPQLLLGVQHPLRRKKRRRSRKRTR